MIQLRTINKIAREFGFELVKGDGYFYWVSDVYDLGRYFDETSVYVENINDMVFTEWIVDLVEKYNRVR
jgi:hypothetical protein